MQYRNHGLLGRHDYTAAWATASRSESDEVMLTHSSVTAFCVVLLAFLQPQKYDYNTNDNNDNDYNINNNNNDDDNNDDNDDNNNNCIHVYNIGGSSMPEAVISNCTQIKLAVGTLLFWFHK